MPTINKIQKLDALTAQDMIPVWDWETSSTKAIEFGHLVTSIQAAMQDEEIDETAVLAILKKWFDDHPALTQKDVDDAITTAFQAANIPTSSDIDGRISDTLRNLGWTVAPLTEQGVQDIVQQYISDNNIGGQAMTQAEVETILVNYMSRNGDQLINDWVAKYMTAHPFPAVPSTSDIETIIYNYIVAHPEVVGGSGSGGADNATIQAQIAAYFQAHPINAGDGLTTTQVAKQISDYLAANPQPGQYDAEDINQFISDWVTAHPNAYSSGFTQTQVETIIGNWLKANPDKVYLPDTVLQSTLLAATTGANLNDAKWQNKTFWAVKAASNYPSAALPNASGAVISDCSYYDENQRQGRVQFAVNADGFAYRVQAAVAGGTATTWGTWGLVDFTQSGGSTVDPADIESAVQTYLGQNPPSGAQREAASWAALKLMTPSKDGERVWLRCYNAGTIHGGGTFIGYKTAKADDGGYICSNGGAYYWQREIALDRLDVTHFGALPDNSTDASGAVYSLFKFLNGSTAKSLNPLSGNMPIRFPAGAFVVNPIDFSTEGAALTETEIQTCAKREAWRRLVMNNGLKTYTDSTGKVITKYQDMDPALGQRVSEQENPSGHKEIPFIGFTGPFTPYGRLPQVQIRSNKADDTFVFLVQSRRTQIHGLRFDGQITQRVAYGGNGPSDGSTRPSNTQGFIKNYCIGGQFWNVTSFQAEWVGGKTFFIKDSLDAKFEQIYSGECWDTVLYSGWTNAVEGNWDHATALELCNCNFQQQMGPNMPPVYMPRMAQSLIRNVWIEHSLCPMDLTDWQGTIDMLCIESSIYPVHAYGARFIFQSWSNPTGVIFDTTTPPYVTQNGVQVDNPKWYSYRLFPDGTKVNVKLGAGYERGNILLETYGVDLNGVIRSNVYQSGRTCNPFPDERWVKIGRLEGWSADGGLINKILSENGGDVSTASAVATEMRLGCQAELRIFSSRNQAAAVSDTKNPLQPGCPGVTVIRCNMYQGGGPSAGVTWHTEGDPVLTDIAVSNYLGNITFWVKVPAKTREIGFMMVATGVTRFNAGQSTNWVDGAGACFPATANPTGEVNFAVPQQRWAVSTKKAGLGLSNDGRIMMATVAPTKVPTGSAPSGWVSIYVNGVEKAIPYYDPQ